MSNAKWIWINNFNEKNAWVCFRKKFTRDIALNDGIFNIAVDSKYWLYVNGQLVIYEGGLNRGPTKSSGYYDEVDLSSYLKKGENVIAILVWYWGNQGRNNVDSTRGGLLFWGLNSEIKSDKTWKGSRHTAYIKSSPPLPSYLYSGDNICYNANYDIGKWQDLLYDENWENAQEIGEYPTLPWGKLRKRPIPFTKFSDIKDFISQIEQEDKIVASLPYAAQINPYIKCSATKSNLKIDIRTDRYEVNGGPGDGNVYNSQRAEYLTKEGVCEFEVLNWMFGEKVIFTVPQGVEIIQLGYRETGYATKLVGEFSCDDSFYNELYEKCKRTLYICMRDNFMDCPDRERGQWIGDVSSQMSQVFYCLDREADKLSKKCIEQFIDWADDGILRGNIPGADCSELPAQSLNAISDIGMIMTYYKNTGDISVIEKSYNAIKKYLSLWEFDEEGFLKVRQGDWCWHDHGEYIDAEILENCWYYMANKAFIQMSEILGYNYESNNVLEKIEHYFDKKFWKTDSYSTGSFIDDRANAMSVLSGLAKADKYDKIIKVLQQQKHSTPYMEGYVLEAMCKMGFMNEALVRMKERYKDLVENENSTLWEDFFVLGTKNHAWSGYPLTILSKYIVGITPLRNGYEKFIIEPYLDGFRKMNFSMHTEKGVIKLEIRRYDGEINININIPQNTTAILKLPNYTKSVMCNSVNINSVDFELNEVDNIIRVITK